MVKKKAAKSKILKLALLVFFVYVIATFTMMQVDISRRRAEIKIANENIEKQKYINDEIKSIIDSSENTEYIMRKAKEKLEMVFPNERVFVDINGNNTK